MEEEKVGTGIEPEPVEQSPEELPTEPVEPVEPTVTPEPVKDDSVDESGVPWKNRAMEERRKREELENQMIQQRQTQSEEEKLEEEEKFYNVDRSVIKTAKEIAKKEIMERLALEKSTSRQVSTVLNSLVSDRPDLANYRIEIEQELDAIPAESRTNPILIRKIAFAVKGEREDPKTKKPAIQPPTKPINASSKPSGEKASVSLTDAEVKFADEKLLWDKNFTEKEIREMYNERQEKLKKLEGK